jgi:hypothetical protein
MRHTNGERPLAVAELGPGATLATCIAALCDRVDKAIGLDVCPYAGGDRINQKMLDELWPESGDRLRYQIIRLYRDEYAAVAGKCQLIRQRNLNRWKFLNP